MKCQYCQTELTKPRAKNCQECTTILNDAYKKGSYAFLMEAVATAKDDGATGEEMRRIMSEAVRLGVARQTEFKAQYREEQKRKAADRSKDIQFFQAHGFWPGQTFEEEDARTEDEEYRRYLETHKGDGDPYNQTEEDLAQKGL